jgi:FkbM family methyltransferase
MFRKASSPRAIHAKCCGRADDPDSGDLVNLFRAIRERSHPLHALRKLRTFQAIPRHFDPMISWRLPQFPKPVYLRLLSHASFIFDAAALEASVRETFTGILHALPQTSGATFWDVGANIGAYTWQCAVVRPDFEIVSFEPDAKNLQCLHRTSRAWNLPRHTIMPQAVAEKAARASFAPDDIAGATGTLEVTDQTFNAVHYGSSSRLIEVDTISLDEFLRTGHHPPAIIKIDVEGAELRVLKGAVVLIGEHRPVLFLEIFSHRHEIFSFLKEFGYSFYDSDRRQNLSDETTNIVALVPEQSLAAAAALSQLGYPVNRHG